MEKTEDINGRTVVNYVKFQCVQDRTNIIDRVNTGDEIKVYFNIKGSKWERDGKTNYITNLDAWRIEQILQNASKTRPAMNIWNRWILFSSTAPRCCR